MRKIFNNVMTLCALVSMLVLSSCSTTKKVVVSGIPGTTIHTPYLKSQIGVIGAEGHAKVKLDSETGFYLSKAPGSDTYVPFATNVKDKFNVFDDLNTLNPLPFAGSIILCTCSCGLLVPVLFQKDKPFNVMTNNDLITSLKPQIIPEESVASVSAVNAMFYVVKSGDTLKKIALENGVTVEQICNLNKIEPTTMLKVGRMLKLR